MLISSILMTQTMSFFYYISSSDTKREVLAACAFMILTSIPVISVSGPCKKIYFHRPGFPTPNNSFLFSKDDV